MSTRYKFIDKEAIYFTTSTVVGCCDARLNGTGRSLQKIENHPVLLNTTEMYNQKLHYIHENPVTAGFVSDCWHWLYSSAMDYHTDKKGLLNIIILDGFRFAKISNKETQGWSPAPDGDSAGNS